MAETVNVPGIGKTNRAWVIGGLAAVAGIVVFAYMRQRTTPEPITEGEYSAGDQWSPDAYAGADAPGGETYDPGAVVNLPPRDIAEWSQRVIDALGTMGFDITFAATTIGKYVAGQALNAGEKLLVQTGIAVVGNTPGTALPIYSAPEPTVPPPPKPTQKTVWRGHRLAVNASWQTLAQRYAASKTPNGIESTRRAMMARNPTIAARIGTRPTAILRQGWIVLIPLRQAA